MPTAAAIDRPPRATSVPVLTADGALATAAELWTRFSTGAELAIDGTLPPAHGQI